MSCVRIYITSKRIELESRGWSGFEFAKELDQPGLSSLIRLEVIKDKRKILVQSYMRFSYPLPNRNTELYFNAHSF